MSDTVHYPLATNATQNLGKSSKRQAEYVPRITQKGVAWHTTLRSPGSRRQLARQETQAGMPAPTINGFVFQP